MNQARLNQSRRWRGVLLVVLCALAYCVSFDHGRDSLRPRLAELGRHNEVLRGEVDRLRGEVARLQGQLAASPPDPGQADTGRISLRFNQIRTLFDGRLVLSVQDFDHNARWALIQIDFVRENRQMTKELTVGDSLVFRLGGSDWAVVLAELTMSAANLNLMEITSNP